VEYLRGSKWRMPSGMGFRSKRPILPM
jgi:hypothetical protein